MPGGVFRVCTVFFTKVGAVLFNGLVISCAGLALNGQIAKWSNLSALRLPSCLLTVLLSFSPCLPHGPPRWAVSWVEGSMDISPYSMVSRSQEESVYPAPSPPRASECKHARLSTKCTSLGPKRLLISRTLICSGEPRQRQPITVFHLQSLAGIPPVPQSLLQWRLNQDVLALHLLPPRVQRRTMRQASQLFCASRSGPSDSGLGRQQWR